MPSMNMHLEKRSSPRISVNVPVQYHVVESHADPARSHHRKTPRVTKSLDLSLGGVFLVADLVMDMGTVLEVEISLPGQSKPLSTFAEVVWANDSGLGLQFTAMKEKDRDALRFFLYQKKSKKT